MTDDDKALVERLRVPCFEIGLDEGWIDAQRAKAADRIEALSAENERLVERHEAFRQEVSDAVVGFINKLGQDDDTFRRAMRYLDGFIIAKPDPLMEALKDMDFTTDWDAEDVKILRAALAKRGLEIRERK